MDVAEGAGGIVKTLSPKGKAMSREKILSWAVWCAEYAFEVRDLRATRKLANALRDELRGRYQDGDWRVVRCTVIIRRKGTA